MPSFSRLILRMAAVVCILPSGLAGCKASGNESPGAAKQPPFMSAVASAPPQAADDAPPPEKTGGFDGKRAFAHVAKLVGFGPHPSGSPAIVQVQDYLLSELKSYGCTVETDAFNANTPAGRLPMKNILVKIPGEKPGVILLGTHYDTKKLDNFVGADDGGSSTGVMLELARLLCNQRGRYAVWIAFFDGEEAVKDWSDTDSRYGSHEMAARLAIDGDLKKIRAFLLADLVGSKGLRFRRESASTRWLTDLVWGVAARLGYATVFLNEESPIDDDHQSFLKRGVPAADVIRCCEQEIPYWHTPQDTLDKISAKSLAITGHVFLESVKQLQAK
jgi:glutaminyl-peptide cyclotransferase